MFFKKKKNPVEIITGVKANREVESFKELDDFVEKKSIEKETLKGLPDEELAKAIRTVLTKSKLN